MAPALRVLLVVAAAVAGGGCLLPQEPVEREQLRVGSCGPDGHVITGAIAGDRMRACNPAIQSMVVSNGVVLADIDGDCWLLEVDSIVAPSLPLVVQFRDVDHATLCPQLDAL